MKWYLVKLIFSIEIGNPGEFSGKPAQFDEQLRLISATDGGHAFGKALELGKKEEAKFYNSAGQIVHWRFINISEVILVNEIYDGIEIYSGTIETDEKQRFINSVQERSALLVPSATLH